MYETIFNTALKIKTLEKTATMKAKKNYRMPDNSVLKMMQFLLQANRLVVRPSTAYMKDTRVM
jgi:hypothetical protein